MQSYQVSPTPARSGVLLTVIAFLAAACVVGVLGLALVTPMLARPRPTRARERVVPLPMMLFARNQIADPARNRQVNLYLASCVNGLSRAVFRSRRHYLAWLGGAQPPVDARPDDLVLTDVDEDPAECERALRRAAALGPADPALEGAGRDYLRAARLAKVALDDASRYYRDRNWQDDGMARGRAMNPALLGVFRSFGQAHDALVARVEALQRAAPSPCAGRPEGDRVVCLAARHQALARRATELAARATVGADGTVVGVDAGELGATVAALEALVRTLSDEQRALTNVGAVEGVFYVQDAEDHLRQLRDLSRVVRNHRRVDAVAWNTPDLDPRGSPAGIVVAFDRVVANFNQIE